LLDLYMSRYTIVMIISLCMALSGKTQSEQGLVACYTFNNGSLDDASGKDPLKVYNCFFVEDRFGNAGSALFFHGTGDSFLNLGPANRLSSGRSSLSLWVKIEKPVSPGRGEETLPVIFIGSASDSSTRCAVELSYHFGLKKFSCASAPSAPGEIQISQIGESSLRTWHHLAMTCDTKELRFYIDGRLQGRVAKEPGAAFHGEDSILAGPWKKSRNTPYLQGCIDDIRMYDRVLSPGEILGLYTEANPNRYAVFLKWGLAGLGLVLILVAGFLIIRWRIAKALKMEKEKNQLRNNWYEQQNRVLRAQMDPHFMFNSLNTIQQFIIIQDNEKAQLYLTKFSRLLRMILETNAREKITLSDEIWIINTYLEIESLRFNNVFRYQIALKGEIRPEEIYIPPFLVQPFVENAIWHGLLPKDGSKELQVEFERRAENILSCVIDDNGVGRKAEGAESAAQAKRSFAISFIRQRLQLMGKLYGETYGVQITDKTNAAGESLGTRVTVTIPILKNQ
jgi:uncharacterized membrane-anchored protein YhcB (DUF1043 family)